MFTNTMSIKYFYFQRSLLVLLNVFFLNSYKEFVCSSHHNFAIEVRVKSHSHQQRSFQKEPNTSLQIATLQADYALKIKQSFPFVTVVPVS